MKQAHLIAALGQIDPDLIEAAGFWDKPRQPAWRRILALAASLVLLAGGSWLALTRLPFFQGAQVGGVNGVHFEHIDGKDVPSFMFYDGPLLPLTLVDDPQDLTSERTLTFAFDPSPDTDVPAKAKVTDHYRVKNTTPKDQTVTLAYPVATSLQDWVDQPVHVSLDGATLKPAITLGPYTGFFEGAWGDTADENRQLNLRAIENWQGYRALLEETPYLEQVFSPPSFPDLPVTVYWFDPILLPEDSTGANPSLAVSYRKDAQTRVLAYGFHGISWVDDTEATQGFSLPDPQRESLASSGYCLIAVGGNLSDIRWQGYENMGWDKGTELDIDAQLTVEKSSLKAITYALYKAFDNQFNSYNQLKTPAEQKEQQVFFDLRFDAFYTYLFSYGLMADQPLARYETGWLEELFGESGRVDRILYLTVPATVPAGGSIDLSLVLEKNGSHDFYRHKGSLPNCLGYDLATRLGSNLPVTDLQACLQSSNGLKITQQNMGFDLDQGVDCVRLDPQEPYYYLLVEGITPSP